MDHAASAILRLAWNFLRVCLMCLLLICLIPFGVCGLIIDRALDWIGIPSHARHEKE